MDLVPRACDDTEISSSAPKPAMKFFSGKAAITRAGCIMFEGWSDYYVMIGGAAAALIGLLFIVATLSADKDVENPIRGYSVYATPTVFHLGIVLLLSATAVAPHLPPALVAVVAGGAGIAGLAYTAWVIRQFTPQDPPPGFVQADLWLYGVLPGGMYLALAIAAELIGLQSQLAPFALALAVIGLLLIAINNAWDLASWLSHPALKGTARPVAMKKETKGFPPRRRN
jgi:hypothetical protein